MSTSPPKRDYPIKHVLVHNWSFDKASSFDEVAENLRQALFYLVRPREDVLVAVSQAKPYILLFLFIQRTSEGGEVFLIETHEGRFSYDELLEHIPALEATAGVKIRL